MESLKKMYNAFPLWGKILFWAVAALIVYTLYKRLLQALQNKNKNNLLNTTVTYTAGNNAGSSTNQSGTTTNIDLGAKAAQIYDAFYDNDWFGFSEDETKAVNALLSVPTPLVPQLSALYFSLYAKNMKEDFVKYTDFSKVSFKFV